MTHRWPQQAAEALCGAGRGLVVLLLLSGLALAVEPSLGGISPLGLTRGTETELTFSGARLGDAQQLLLYTPGIEVTAITPVNDGSFKAKLKAAADCPLGTHAVRVRTATGVSNLRTFGVGALPVIAEVEPNSEFDKPQVVTPGCTIHGVVQNEDVDYFAVDLKKGDRLSAEIEGLRLGVNFFDPYIAILNARRFEVARSDDCPLLWQDGVCTIVAPEDGRYIVQVRESSFGGGGDSFYRLHLGAFPRPTAVYPPGGRPGEALELTLLGDAYGARKQKVTLPAKEGNFEFFAQDEKGIAPSPNVMRVNNLPSALEAEPNDDGAHATPCTAPGAASGIIDKPGDVDYFKFHGAKGQVFDVRVYAREVLRSPLDSVLTVTRASNGQVIGSNDDNGGPDSYLRITIPEEDDYLIAVTDHLKAGGPDFVYRVEITPVAVALTMRLPERQQYVSNTIVAPRNNRIAALISAERANFGGELQLQLAGLPAGMTAEVEPFSADRNEVAVIFSAAAGAAPAGALVDVVGRPTDANVKVEGHLNQRTMLVRGQNNREVWGQTAERMATVIASEVPFSLQIVQPKVPLVKNGSMNLKVVATRAAGFTAPISLSLLYNPAGVASSGAITIPENQTEALIPLTANGGATVRKWKIVVIGRAALGGAAVEAATPFADLDIAEQYVNLAFPKGAVEKGKEADYVVTVEKKKDFAGEALVELLGLPAGTVTEPAKITAASTAAAFKVKTTPEARAGKYPSLVCRVTITEQGEPVTHTLGQGELRVDEPIPPKPNAPPAPPPMPPPMPVAQAPAPPAPPKPLSRLEQLRLEKQGKK